MNCLEDLVWFWVWIEFWFEELQLGSNLVSFSLVLFIFVRFRFVSVSASFGKLLILVWIDFRECGSLSSAILLGSALFSSYLSILWCIWERRYVWIWLWCFGNSATCFWQFGNSSSIICKQFNKFDTNNLQFFSFKYLVFGFYWANSWCSYHREFEGKC